MAGLVIDGGNLLGQQRIAQNGADAAANAGTLVIAESLAGPARSGQNVLDAISASAAANGLGNVSAEYTDGFGNSLGITVAGGSIPSGARGVNVGGDRSVGTTLVRAVGITQLTASADATAVAGALATFSGGGVLPVTFPVAISDCDGGGSYRPGSAPWPIVDANARDAGNDGNMVTVPLCRTSEGSVGWLDLGSGNLEDQIVNGPGPGVSIPIPAWLQTKTGNMNNVENAINNNYADTPVLIPMFDDTCKVDPGGNLLACPADKKGTNPSGNNTWYHVPYFTNFWVYQAYIQGANLNQCTSKPGTPETIDPSSPGFLGCIKGWFVEYVYDGPIDPNREITSDTAIGIQLIR